MSRRRSARSEFLLALVVSTLVSIGFFVYGAWRNQSLEFNYLPWNLFLAWLPLLFAIRLTQILGRKLWSSWEAMGISVLWVIFLPNSFYMISDFIHLQDVQRLNILYDTIMFTSFIYTGVVLGFSSLYLVHLQLKKRLTSQAASAWIGFTIVACSVAVYLGRDLRWNSWDVVTNPGGVLFDVSDRVIHPAAYPQMFLTIVSFSILLGSMYALLWRGAGILRQTT